MIRTIDRIDNALNLESIVARCSFDLLNFPKKAGFEVRQFVFITWRLMLIDICHSNDIRASGWPSGRVAAAAGVPGMFSKIAHRLPP